MVSVSRLGSRFRMEFLSTLVATISGALLVVVLARLLDPDGYGLLYLTLAVIGVTKLFAKLGLGRSTARYITEYKEKDPTQLRHILKFSAGISLALLFIVTLVVSVGHRQIATLIGEPDVAPFLVLGSLFLVFGTTLGFLRKVLQGFEAIQLAALLSIIRSVTKAVVAIGLVVASFGAMGALAGWVLGAFLASLIGIIVVYSRYYRSLDFSAPVESGLRRRIAEYAVPVAASEAAGNLSSRIDTVLVGFFLNPVAVSYYVVAEQVVSMVQSPSNALGFTLAPTFGSEKSAGNAEKAARIYEEAFQHMALLYLPAAAGIILVSEPLVELVFGTDYLGAVPVLQVLGLYAFVKANILVSAKALDFLGRARSRAIVKGVTSVLNVLLNIALIPTVGVVGAAIATVITSSMYAIANIYIIYDELHLRIVHLIWRTLQIIGITLLMSLVVFVLLDQITGWITLLLVVCVGVAVWAALSVLSGILDIERVLSAVF
ncbi:flippase [Natrialba sp. INN-245]|uniref:flippase n=1 Tax=Natrialba sp. INN-245 TaxID=2690967 RepID=UPI0013136EBF|nr:flippase [Natrialba sp. INN-245]MWV40049.1 oligosaccharide flippase family protein [Natrialba sp. INN-245]